MADNIISFLIGAFIGGNVSFFALALIMASKGGDNHNDY
jgi:gas vesicle protein